MPILDDSEIKHLLLQIKSQPSENLESETVEFKGYRDERALHNSKDISEELSALANLKGGTIIVGVRDSSDVFDSDWLSQLQGIPNVDLLQTKERLKGRLQPKVELSVRSVIYDGIPFVVIEIEKSIDSLVSTSSGKTCIRDGRSSRPMTPGEIEQAVKSLTRYDWSGDCLTQSSLAQLDPVSLKEAVADFRSRRDATEQISEESYLEAVGATQNGTLTRGGLLFLGSTQSIRETLGDFEFRFTWRMANGDLVINDIWSGNLWQAIKKAGNYFNLCNETGTFVYQNTAFKSPLIDPIAFHEAYLNALVHRDYSIDGMVSVTYTGDELKVHSPGAFYGGVNSQNIAIHEPRHRNKNLARTLMTHSLVDRAGMGVLRMGLGSLRYGRGFPEFRELADAVEVVMEAKYLRAGVAVLAFRNKDSWGVPELLIVNSVYETGVVSVVELESRLQKVVASPWAEINKAVEQMRQVELCGTRDGVFIRVLPDWKEFLDVGRSFRVSSSSPNYVKLYQYLRSYGQATNADLTELLGYSHSSQTSRFLREANFVERRGDGPGASWLIVEK